MNLCAIKKIFEKISFHRHINKLLKTGKGFRKLIFRDRVSFFRCGKLRRVLNMAEFSKVEKNEISLMSLYETCLGVLSREFGLIKKKYVKGLYVNV